MARTPFTGVLALVLAACGGGGGTPVEPDAAPGRSELVVHLLDVGLGDAIYITNGASKVLIDGGGERARLAQHLDRLGVENTVLDAVILSHVHYDHHGGLRALFDEGRGLVVRRFFENGDAFSSTTLAQLRDSVRARERRGELEVRDTDDPCGDGSPVCTLLLDGGALLHVLRPNPNGSSPNDRSTAVKLVGPDSASFTMWLAGDAEHEQIDWFLTGSGYRANPGMRAHVLKANHHGDCNGVTPAYLQAVAPEQVVISLGAEERLGYVHDQTKNLMRTQGLPWFRTDRNGTVTLRSPGVPGGGYRVEVEHGRSQLDGLADRASAQRICN